MRDPPRECKGLGNHVRPDIIIAGGQLQSLDDHLGRRVIADPIDLIVVECVVAHENEQKLMQRLECYVNVYRPKLLVVVAPEENKSLQQLQRQLNKRLSVNVRVIGDVNPKGSGLSTLKQVIVNNFYGKRSRPNDFCSECPCPSAD